MLCATSCHENVPTWNKRFFIRTETFVGGAVTFVLLCTVEKIQIETISSIVKKSSSKNRETMTRTQKFLKNTGATALLQVLTFAVGMLTPRIMLSVYGSETNGLITSINQFITYFRLSEAGLSAAIVYALYQPLAQEHQKNINTILSTGKCFYQQAGKFLFLMLGILLLTYPQLMKQESLSPQQTAVLILLLGLDGLTLNFFFAQYGAFLQANQKSYVLSLCSMVQLLCHLMIVLCFAKESVSITVFLMLAQLPILLRSFLQYFYCKKYYPDLSVTEKINPDCLAKRKDARYHQILTVVNTGAPVILLTLITQDLKLVSLYSIFNIVITGLNGFLGVFSTVLPATFGDLITRKELATLQKAHNSFEFIFYTLLSLVYGITFVTIMPFIRIYTANIHDINYDLPLFGILFVLSSLVYMIAVPQGILITAAGHYEETKGQVTIQCGILLSVSVISLYFFGIYGVLLGSLSSALYLCLAWLTYAPKNITEVSLLPSLKRVFGIFVCIFFIVLPFLFVTIPVTGFLTWMLYASVVGIYAVAVVTVWCFFMEKEAVVIVLERLKKAR